MLTTTTSYKPQVVKARCHFCKRVLTSAESIARGTGDECAEKLARMLAALDAGRAIERTLGDYKLLRLGGELKQLERLEVLRPNSAKLQQDLHDARKRYAARVEYLAEMGMMTIPEPEPTFAPVAPTDEEMTAMAHAHAEPMIERRELRRDGQVERLPLTEALLAIQDESPAAAASRSVMKDIARRLRAGQPYENWYSAYSSIVP